MIIIPIQFMMMAKKGKAAKLLGGGSKVGQEIGIGKYISYHNHHIIRLPSGKEEDQGGPYYCCCDLQKSRGFQGCAMAAEL